MKTYTIIIRINNINTVVKMKAKDKMEAMIKAREKVIKEINFSTKLKQYNKRINWLKKQISLYIEEIKTAPFEAVNSLSKEVGYLRKQKREVEIRKQNFIKKTK